jgi:hypothetical protein
VLYCSSRLELTSQKCRMPVSAEESSADVYLWYSVSTVNVLGKALVEYAERSTLKRVGGSSSLCLDGETGEMGTMVPGIDEFSFSWYRRICMQDG